MKNPKDMLLADAIEQAIESNRKMIVQNRIIVILSISNVLFIIAFLVELICG